MSWLKHHRKAETLSQMAEVILLRENSPDAREEAQALYQKAGDLEYRAFFGLSDELLRTRAIIAVSTLALYKKADMPHAMRHFRDGLDDSEAEKWPEWARFEIDAMMKEADR